MQAFLQAQRSGQGDMPHILQASITSLDEAFLANLQVPSLVSLHTTFVALIHCCTNMKTAAEPLCCRVSSKPNAVCAQDRAVSAASGVIVYLDFKAEKIWAGQIGTTRQLVIGQLFHGLAVQRTEALVLDNNSRYSWQLCECLQAGALFTTQPVQLTFRVFGTCICS